MFEFDTEQDALDYINENFTHPLRFQFSRTGWEYTKDNTNIYIEDVENYSPTLEIEGDISLFDKFNVTKFLEKSMPEIMRN